MKATELRIGNWYHGDVTGEPNYLQIEAKDIVELDSDPLDDYYQPIPLTEEWLVKFGIKSSNWVYLDESIGALYWDNYEGCFYIWSSMGDASSYGFKKECKYVHQLQNLYFALTDEELILTK